MAVHHDHPATSSAGKDVSGFGKVLWVILLIVLPYIGIFTTSSHKEAASPSATKARARYQRRDELRQVVGFSIADELSKLDRLKSEKSISDAKYLRLRAAARGLTPLSRPDARIAPVGRDRPTSGPGAGF